MFLSFAENSMKKVVNRWLYTYVPLLVLISVVLVMFQALRVAPLIDVTYMLESANRLFWGQFPYRDFYLVLPPGSFYIMSWVMKIFGKNYFCQIVYVVFEQSFLVIATASLIRKYNSDTLTTSLLAAMMVFGGHAILPFPSYDIPAALFVTISLILFIRSKTAWSYFGLGILSFFPTLFKQNVGLVFLLSLLGSLFAKMVFVDRAQNAKYFFSFLSGTLLIVFIFVFWLYWNDALQDCYIQLFVHPRSIRNPVKGVFEICEQFVDSTSRRFAYPIIAMIIFEHFVHLKSVCLRIENTTYFNFSKEQLIKMLHFIVMLCFIFYAYSFIKKPTLATWWHIWPAAMICSCYCSFRHERLTNSSLAIFVIVLTCLAAFISQGFWGSSYSMWGLLSVLLAATFSKIPTFRKVNVLLVFFLCAVLGHDIYTNARLQYISYEGRNSISRLNHMSCIGTNGDWFSEIYTIEKFINTTIMADESFTQIPGEDPLYYITDRKPHLKYFQLNATTFLHNSHYMLDDIKRNNIKWVIFKTKLQCPGGYLDTTTLKQGLSKNYVLYTTFDSYLVYRIKG